jgi:hypothetical protein
MNPNASIGWRRLLPSDRWDRATAALLLVAALLVVATFRDYGLSWDERPHRQHGKALISWFATVGADKAALDGGPTGLEVHYGLFFDGLAEGASLILPVDPVDGRHLVFALTGLVGLLGVARLARRLGGPRAGFFAAALLVTTPVWWGHGFINPKDIPFAAPYPWLLLTLLNLADDLPRVRWPRILAAGTALGMGLSARPGGLAILLALGAGILGLRAFAVLRSGTARRLPLLGGAAGAFVGVTAVGWGWMMVGWPTGFLSPLKAPFQAVAAASFYPWTGLVRFAGSWQISTELPRSYAPLLMATTLPETWFLIAAVGVAGGWLAWRRDGVRPRFDVAWLDPVLVAGAGFGPILAAAATRPVLYDGLRHLLFAVPALAAFGGWALAAALERLPTPGRRAALGVVGAAATLAAVDMIRLHPYEYIYANRLVAGGLEGASRDWELDYWGTAGREAMDWVVRNVVPPDGQSVNVGTTADWYTAGYYIEGDPVASRRYRFDLHGAPELRLATTRWHQHRAPGRVLHVVERMGVPLLYIIDARPTGGDVQLEAGDRSVTLRLPFGWSAEPEVRRDDELTRYVLRPGFGGYAEVSLTIVTPGTGAVPGLATLRDEVVAQAGDLRGVNPEAIAPEPVVGPGGRGWFSAGSVRTGQGPVLAGAGAMSVGDAAVLAVARFAGDPTKGSADLLTLIRSVRLTEGGDRRRP